MSDDQKPITAMQRAFIIGHCRTLKLSRPTNFPETSKGAEWLIRQLRGWIILDRENQQAKSG